MCFLRMKLSVISLHENVSKKKNRERLAQKLVPLEQTTGKYWYTKREYTYYTTNNPQLGLLHISNESHTRTTRQESFLCSVGSYMLEYKLAFPVLT